MKQWIAIAMVLLATTAGQAAELKPEFRRVQLKENTMLNLSVMPDAGTQLVFPFELDNPDLEPSLKIRLTNPDGFSVPTDPKAIETLLKGQNTITIEGKANPGDPGAKYLGNLFITIGGYNLSIALRTTYDTTEHVSNIVFDISDEDRTHMIESAVERKTKRLDRRHEEKMAALDQRAKELSLNHVAIMAMETPSTTNFKADGRVPIDDYSITVFADKMTQFGEKYHILLFDLENRSSVDFTVQDLQLVAVNGDREKTIEGSFECDPRLNADTTLSCSFSTLERLMADANRLRLDVVTDRGEGSFQW